MPTDYTFKLLCIRLYPHYTAKVNFEVIYFNIYYVSVEEKRNVVPAAISRQRLLWTVQLCSCRIKHNFLLELHTLTLDAKKEDDEAHFWLKGYDNKQNCRIWSEAKPQVYVETPLHPEKLTVWCALWAGGILLQKR
ncbi:hypothetical protein TNCV_1343211 [Trichonephila clavipes]|nr:hypothetical protein TNCV_1343211 [Trichonephila clavipes]